MPKRAATLSLSVLLVGSIAFVRCNPHETSTAPESRDEPQLTIAKLNGGAERALFLPDDTLAVSCSGTALPDTGVVLALSVDSGDTWVELHAIPRDGDERSWFIVVPWHMDEPHCRMRLSTETDTVYSNPFGIKALVAVLPHEGDVFRTGDTLVVEWHAHNTIQNVVARLLYSVEGTNRPEEMEIMANASTTVGMSTWPAIWPRYYWIIPDTVSCRQCWVEIEDYIELNPTDYTGLFSILPR
jgi:hypothetical protein